MRHVGDQHKWCSVLNKANEIWAQAFIELKELDWGVKAWWWLITKIMRREWKLDEIIIENVRKEIERIRKG